MVIRLCEGGFGIMLARGLVDDFRIVRSEGAIHVLNAPSPGATASISIGERIAAMAAEALGRS